jgi:signal transduction histidine kinase
VQPFSRYYPHIQFKIEGEAPAEKILHYSKALNVVRVVQEAITNAIKHSSASGIVIKSVEDNGKWKLTISDDGKGFYKENREGAEMGNGLQNMKQRASEAMFDVEIISEDGKGTSVIIIV